MGFGLKVNCATKRHCQRQRGHIETDYTLRLQAMGMVCMRKDREEIKVPCLTDDAQKNFKLFKRAKNELHILRVRNEGREAPIF